MPLTKSSNARYAFLGSPEFAEIILIQLIESGMPPSIVICNPDKPFGRKKIVTPPPVKVLALKHGIKVWQPERLTLEEWRREVGDIDFAVVAAYAKIIKKEILDTARLGFIGVHPSLLPKYRGATPIQSALLSGEKETGITLYFVDEFVDHGPMIASEKCAIAEDEAYNSLLQKLARMGGKVLREVIPELTHKSVKAEPQNEAEATFTKKFKTEDGFVDPAHLREAQSGASLEKAEIILRKIKALNPEPGVYTFENRKRVKLLEAALDGNKLKTIKIQIEGEKPKNATLTI